MPSNSPAMVIGISQLWIGTTLGSVSLLRKVLTCLLLTALLEFAERNTNGKVWVMKMLKRVSSRAASPPCPSADRCCCCNKRTLYQLTKYLSEDLFWSTRKTQIFPSPSPRPSGVCLRKNDVALVTLSVSTLDVGCINPEEIK
jgi:hypothetical protein